MCQEVVKKGEVIPATGHDYKDGKCTNCGETDPNYKPAEPENPTRLTPLCGWLRPPFPCWLPPPCCWARKST